MNPSLQSLDPIRLAESNTRLTGTVQLSHLSRLQDIIKQEGEIAFEVQFRVDEQGLYVIEGRVNSPIKLACQRCMQPMSLTISSDFLLSPVRNDTEASRLPKYYEPLLLEADRTISLEALIEDEILLNLPIVPMHTEKECSVKVLDTSQASVEEERENPFKVLKEHKFRNKH